MNRVFLGISTSILVLLTAACATNPPPAPPQAPVAVAAKPPEPPEPKAPPAPPAKKQTSVTLKGQLDRCEPGKTYTVNGKKMTCQASVQRQIGTCITVENPDGTSKKECHRFDE